MSTFYSQGSDVWSKLTNWDTNPAGGGTDPASADEAGMDNHTFIVQAGHTISLDIDGTGWTNGIAGCTIQGHATTPGTLRAYGACGAVGLKIKTGTTIAGTDAAVKGRLLVNLSGVWGETGSLAWGNSCTFLLNTTGYIDAQYLDIALYDTEPANKYVETYGTKYTCTEASTDVAPDTDLITFAEGTPPSAGTPVMVRSAGVLPGGLTTTDIYYVRSITDLGATFTCKLCLQNSDDSAVNITSAGSGALYMYSGHTSTSTATMNVIQNVTGDAQWASGASVTLVDCNAPENCDQQRVTINGAPNAGDITLSANVDSAQYPLARITLMTRNVAIRSNTTGYNIVVYASGSTHGGVFQCEIRSTAGTGTTFYGYGVNYGTSHTISGTISGCNSGLNHGTSHTISGTVSGCNSGLNGTSHTISGTVSGCNSGLNYGTSHTISGTVSGCNSGLNSGTSHTISGTVSGNSYNFRFQNAYGTSNQNLQDIIVRGRAICAASFVDRNLAYGGDQQVYFEDYGGVLGEQYAAHAQGDVYRNVGTLRSGGAASSIRVVPLSSLAGGGYVRFFEWTELDVPEDAEITRTIYVYGEGWSTFPLATELYIEAEYLNHASLLTTATIKSEQVLAANEAWTVLSVTFTPLQVGPVRYKAYLKKYEAAAEIHVDNALYTS